MALGKNDYFFISPIEILNLDDLLLRHVLHYICVSRTNHFITSFLQGWNSHPLRNEKNWTPQQICTNRMIDQKRWGILHIAQMNDIPVGSVDFNWFSKDLYPPNPADEGLKTVNLDDVFSPLNREEETILKKD